MKRMVLLVAVVALVAVLTGCATTETAGGSSAAVAAASAPAGSAFSLWNFEDGTTSGFAGKGKWSEVCSVNEDAKFVKEGAKSLKINAKGSTGWNQDICTNSGPFHENFNKLKEITMDVYVPADTMKGLEYGQIFIVISGSANAWYQVPQALKVGWNSLVYKIDTDNVSGDIWHMYLVFNSNVAFNGPVYVDNVMGKI